MNFLKKRKSLILAPNKSRNDRSSTIGTKSRNQSAEPSKSLVFIKKSNKHRVENIEDNVLDAPSVSLKPSNPIQKTKLKLI